LDEAANAEKSHLALRDLKVFIQLKAFGFQIAVTIAVNQVVSRADAGGDSPCVRIVVR